MTLRKQKRTSVFKKQKDCGEVREREREREEKREDGEAWRTI
jgi:hypothetical protein